MHYYLKAPKISYCRKCGKPVLPHKVCANCGYYKEKMVIDVFKKLTKREQKKKQQEIKNQEKAPKKDLSMEELSKK